MSAFDARTCNATRQTGCDAIGNAPVPPCSEDPNSLCGPFAAKVDRANNTIYEAGGTNTVWVFDGRRCHAGDLAGCATDTPGAFAPFPQPGFEVSISVAVDTRLHSVYVAYHKDDALLVIDTDRCNGRHLAACATLGPREIHTGTNPVSVALDPTTQTLYTANVLDDTVSVIDPARCSARVARGCRPRVPEAAIPGVPTVDGGVAGTPAADPANGTVYVPGPTGVTLIDSRRCNAWRSADGGELIYSATASVDTFTNNGLLSGITLVTEGLVLLGVCAALLIEPLGAIMAFTGVGLAAWTLLTLGRERVRRAGAAADTTIPCVCNTCSRA